MFLTASCLATRVGKLCLQCTLGVQRIGVKQVPLEEVRKFLFEVKGWRSSTNCRGVAPSVGTESDNISGHRSREWLLRHCLILGAESLYSMFFAYSYFIAAFLPHSRGRKV